jgi:hypothetical protein
MLADTSMYCVCFNAQDGKSVFCTLESTPPLHQAREIQMLPDKPIFEESQFPEPDM